jgi:hypothetical protein
MLLRLRTAVGKLKFVEGVDEHPREFLLLDVQALIIYDDFGGVQMRAQFVSPVCSLQFVSFDVGGIVIQILEYFGGCL